MSPAAASGRRRTFVDPRLLIGLGLVVVSVAGMTGLLAAVDSRVTVLAAASSLVPGERVGPADLIERSVSLDGADELYLRVGDLPDEGLVAVQAVQRGELVPRSAVADAEAQRSTTLVIASATPVGSGVQPGARVELWVSPVDPDAGGFGAASVLVQEAIVVRVLDDEGLMSGASRDAVEVRVPRSRIARILQAQADGDLIAVVPAGLPLGE